MSPRSWSIEHHGVVTSTNDRLKAAARGGAPDRTVFVARQQTRGHGRGSNTWTSPEGGLYLSALLRTVPDHVAPLLAFVAGEAVARAVEDLRIGVPLWLKWPNDVLIAPPGEKAPVGKAGGILVEAVARGERIDHAVLGIGLNLRTDAADLPVDQDPPAVSFAGFVAAVPDDETFLVVLLSHLDSVLKMAATSPQLLVDAVARRLAWKGEPVRATRVDGGVVTGTLQGLAPDGALRLGTPTGEVRLDSWDVSGLDRGS